MKLYKYMDDEIHWIAARNQDEAHVLYLRDCTDEAPDDLVVKELEREKWAAIGVRLDDAPPGESNRSTAAEIIGDPDDERDAFLVASTCY